MFFTHIKLLGMGDVLVVALAAGCYLNSLGCGFVFDDMSAIRDNRDLRPSTSINNLLYNDFWGTPIHKEHSHKSYRPLCVLTFRLNYLFDELNPFGYHLINILLHILVSLLYHRLCCQFLVNRVTGLVAALLFAVHPVHSEAVTGVVGRAESLSSVFFLLALMAYAQSVGKKGTSFSRLFSCMLFICMATLSKEQGITVTAVCIVYELFHIQGLGIWEMFGPPFDWLWEAGPRLFALSATATLLLLARFTVMGAQLPVFTKFDNPAAVADFPVRQLTLTYLLPFNAWLLLDPWGLCCDWTMGSIPLVTSIADPRNLATLGLLMTLGLLLFKASKDRQQSPTIFMCVALLVFPFLPASNLFFPVGFVVAERVLYTPSMGFCLLVAHGFNRIRIGTSSHVWRRLLILGMIFLLASHTLKTILRNYDWSSEYSLFMSGIGVNQRNAKLYNNVGHALENQGNFTSALHFFIKASQVQPDDLGAHMNVGRTYTNLEMYPEAERAFWKAKALLPRPRLGVEYQARIAPSHLNVFLNLANLIARNRSRLQEADNLYRQAISMRSDYIQAYINRGDILLKLNKTREAQEVYESALKLDNTNPDIYYNLGVICLEQSKATQALAFFDQALQLDPEHEQALMNSAILIQESGNANLRWVAFQRLELLLSKGKVNERVYFNLGMLAMDDKKTQLAEAYFKRAVELKVDFRSALFNLALLLSDQERPLEAVPFLKQLLHHHPTHIKGLILLGDIYINNLKDVQTAKKCYERILELDPSNIQALHNLCVVHVERGELSEAEECLLKARAMGPSEDYIQKHLRIVRARMLRPQQKATT